jgi:hypothetical protein
VVDGWGAREGLKNTYECQAKFKQLKGALQLGKELEIADQIDS